MATVTLQGLAGAQRRVQSLPRQLRFGAALGLNNVAFKVRDAWIQGMRQAFDRPTPYLLSSIVVDQKATKERLEATVRPVYRGKKGIEPSKTLAANVFGGQRRMKGFDRRLQMAGLMPEGMQAVPAPGIADGPYGDGYGNVKGSFIVKLLAYLQAFTLVGDYNNMSKRNRLRMSGRGRWQGRFFGAQTKRGQDRRLPMAYRSGGVEFFVSRGKTAGAAINVERHKNRDQHLAAGIWERSGIYGARVRPIFYFQRPPTYQRRLPLQTIGDQVVATHLPAAVVARTQDAIRTAR